MALFDGPSFGNTFFELCVGKALSKQCYEKTEATSAPTLSSRFFFPVSFSIYNTIAICTAQYKVQTTGNTLHILCQVRVSQLSLLM